MVKSFRLLALLIALLLGGVAGYFVLSPRGERAVMAGLPKPVTADPYAQLGSGSASPSAQTPASPPEPSVSTPSTTSPSAAVTPQPVPAPAERPKAPPATPPSQSQAAPVPVKPPAKVPVQASTRGQPVSAVLPKQVDTAEVKFSGSLPTHADGWYDLGRQARQAGDHRKAAKAFAQAAALNPSAANWRALADEYVALRQFNEATRAYDQAAAKYRAGGDDMTARALEYLAAPYRQTLELLAVVPKAGGTQLTLAKFEPPRGVMLGIHVGGNGVLGAWGKPPRMAASMKPFAVAFRYWKFTKSTEDALVFPGRFAQAAKSNGMALHLALEPGMPLSQISDDIIRRFAAQARTADLPIFVRFASEMNDPHNEWSRDPALYRRTFKRVADILHHEAPNVAMVWMPMPGDLNVMEDYYPGADAVDWAGLSLYSVPFENGDLTKPRLNAHPLEVIDGFYKAYAPRHPIQLSEYASSNRSGASPEQDFSAYAAQQLREVYWGAWLKYPRLKNINWLDLDMHTDPLVRQGEANRKNDYRLFGVPAKWKAFTEVKGQDAYFQSFRQSQCRTCSVNTARTFPRSVIAGQPVSGVVWVQAAQPVQKVIVALDGYTVDTGAYLPYAFTLRPDPGKHRLQAWVIDNQNRILNQTEKVFVAK